MGGGRADGPRQCWVVRVQPRPTALGDDGDEVAFQLYAAPRSESALGETRFDVHEAAGRGRILKKMTCEASRGVKFPRSKFPLPTSNVRWGDGRAVLMLSALSRCLALICAGIRNLTLGIVAGWPMERWPWPSNLVPLLE